MNTHINSKDSLCYIHAKHVELYQIDISMSNCTKEAPIGSGERSPFSLVGEKCCNTIILDPQQFKIVAVGQTFRSFVGTTFTSFVGPTAFVSQQMKTVGVGGNYAIFVVALLL